MFLVFWKGEEEVEEVPFSHEFAQENVSPAPWPEPVDKDPVEYQEVGATKGDEEDQGMSYEDKQELPEENAVEEIVIDNFIGTPTDLEIKVGTTVRIKNEHHNYKHIIGIREWIGTEYERAPLDGWNVINTGEHYDFKFKKTGEYLWMSKSSYPRTSGQIKVV